MHPEQFNKWFNELFDKVKLNNEYTESGYGDWLKTQDDEEVEKCTNNREMNELINKKKTNLRNTTISKYNSINGFNDSGYCDLANSRPEEYSSGMFSKLQYEDLKKAHEESVVPVTEEDFKPKYNNLEEMKIKRSQQNLTPLTENEAREYMHASTYNDNFVSSHRAFKLAKQEEEAEKANKTWWASLKQIK